MKVGVESKRARAVVSRTAGVRICFIDPVRDADYIFGGSVRSHRRLPPISLHLSRFLGGPLHACLSQGHRQVPWP